MPEAFGKYVNTACEKRGKELLKEATEEHKKKAEYGKKETYQAAKEGATYLRNRTVGKIMISGTQRYCCFECTHNKINFKVCHTCRDGSAFEPKQKEAAHVA